MVTFDLKGSGETTIVISGSLAAQGTSDGDGNALFTKYVDGIVEILKKGELTVREEN